MRIDTFEDAGMSVALMFELLDVPDDMAEEMVNAERSPSMRESFLAGDEEFLRTVGADRLQAQEQERRRSRDVAQMVAPAGAGGARGLAGIVRHMAAPLSLPPGVPEEEWSTKANEEDSGSDISFGGPPVLQSFGSGFGLSAGAAEPGAAAGVSQAAANSRTLPLNLRPTLNISRVGMADSFGGGGGAPPSRGPSSRETTSENGELLPPGWRGSGFVGPGGTSSKRVSIHAAALSAHPVRHTDLTGLSTGVAAIISRSRSGGYLLQGSPSDAPPGWVSHPIVQGAPASPLPANSRNPARTFRRQSMPPLPGGGAAPAAEMALAVMGIPGASTEVKRRDSQHSGQARGALSGAQGASPQDVRPCLAHFRAPTPRTPFPLNNPAKSGEQPIVPCVQLLTTPPPSPTFALPPSGAGFVVSLQPP